MAKILLNGSEPTDIKLNSSTPDKIMLNGVTYWELAKQVLKRIDYSNSDVYVGSPGREIIFEDANANSTVANFYLDLKRYKFAGSQSRQWSSTTSVYSYDGSKKSIYLIWGTQSGSSQQNFDIVEVPDPSRLAVIQEWITVNQGGDIEINLPSSKVTLDDVIVDFRNVSTYDTLNGGAWNEIGRSIQNNKLILTFPNYFSSTSYLDIRVLCSV